MGLDVKSLENIVLFKIVESSKEQKENMWTKYTLTTTTQLALEPRGGLESTIGVYKWYQIWWFFVTWATFRVFYKNKFGFGDLLIWQLLKQEKNIENQRTNLELNINMFLGCFLCLFEQNLATFPSPIWLHWSFRTVNKKLNDSGFFLSILQIANQRMFSKINFNRWRMTMETCSRVIIRQLQIIFVSYQTAQLSDNS